MVKDADQEIHVLLALDADVAQNGVDLEHVPLLLRQAEDLLPHLQIQQELRLLLDQVENLLDLRGGVLARGRLRHILGLDGRALAGGSAGLREGLKLELELLGLRLHPLVAQLLFVEQPIRLQDLRNEAPHLLLVHLPHLSELLLVGLLKVLELLLQVFELPRQALVLFGQIHVLVLVLLIQSVVAAHQRVQSFPELVQPVLVRRLNGLVLLVSFGEDLEIVTKLLFVQLVCRHHLLVVLLQLLNAFLQGDLALVVVVREVCAQLLDLLLEAPLALLPPLQELALLHLAALLKERLDLLLVLGEEVRPLLLEGVLDLLELLLVVPPHGVVLLPHLRDDARDVSALLLKHLDVLLILVLQLLLEVANPAIFRVDDLLAGLLLELQLVIQLLRNVHVQQVCPLHLDGGILSAAGHGLDLEGLISVEPVVFLHDAPLVLGVVEANPDVRELVPGLRAYPLEDRGGGADLLLAQRHLLLHHILFGLLALLLLLLEPDLRLRPPAPSGNSRVLRRQR
mmetsp:Transcript_23062/g.64927  ORF Transcript_23062/g.64927 Transcript_23062/m.64927 type:complete len:512 (+) Transcript_23062:520-2055(+)